MELIIFSSDPNDTKTQEGKAIKLRDKRFQDKAIIKFNTNIWCANSTELE